MSSPSEAHAYHHNILRVVGKDTEKKMILLGGFDENRYVWFEDDVMFHSVYGYRRAKEVKYTGSEENAKN